MSGRNLDRRKLMAAGAAVYLAVLAACGCVLMGAPRGHLSPTERDFIIAVAISANIYALLSMTRLCRVIFSGAGAGGSSRVGTITGDGRTDAQNGTAVKIGTSLQFSLVGQSHEILQTCHPMTTPSHRLLTQGRYSYKTQTMKHAYHADEPLRHPVTSSISNEIKNTFIMQKCRTKNENYANDLSNTGA